MAVAQSSSDGNAIRPGYFRLFGWRHVFA